MWYLQFQAVCILPVIFLLALAFSSPVFLHTHLHTPSLGTEGEPSDDYEYYYADVQEETLQKKDAGHENDLMASIPWDDITFCIEDWSYKGNLYMSATGFPKCSNVLFFYCSISCKNWLNYGQYLDLGSIWD